MAAHAEVTTGPPGHAALRRTTVTSRPSTNRHATWGAIVSPLCLIPRATPLRTRYDFKLLGIIMIIGKVTLIIGTIMVGTLLVALLAMWLAV